MKLFYAISMFCHMTSSDLSLMKSKKPDTFCCLLMSPPTFPKCVLWSDIFDGKHFKAELVALIPLEAITTGTIIFDKQEEIFMKYGS